MSAARDKTEKSNVSPSVALRIWGLPAGRVRRGLIAAAVALGCGQLIFSLMCPVVWQTIDLPMMPVYHNYIGRMWVWDWWASTSTPPITWNWQWMPWEILACVALTVGCVSVICGFLPRRLVYPKTATSDK